MNLIDLEFKQLHRSKMFYIAPLLFFVLFAFFFGTNARDNIEKVWQYENSMNGQNASSLSFLPSGADEEQIKIAKERDIAKQKAYEDALFGGFMRDKEAYLHGMIKMLTYRLNDGGKDEEWDREFEQDVMLYQKVIENKNNYIFDSLDLGSVNSQSNFHSKDR